MGDAVASTRRTAGFEVRVEGTAPLERIDFFRGTQCLRSIDLFRRSGRVVEPRARRVARVERAGQLAARAHELGRRAARRGRADPRGARLGLRHAGRRASRPRSRARSAGVRSRRATGTAWCSSSIDPATRSCWFVTGPMSLRTRLSQPGPGGTTLRRAQSASAASRSSACPNACRRARSVGRFDDPVADRGRAGVLGAGAPERWRVRVVVADLRHVRASWRDDRTLQ